jgi:dipeptidyl-peptidase 4
MVIDGVMQKRTFALALVVLGACFPNSARVREPQTGSNGGPRHASQSVELDATDMQDIAAQTETANFRFGMPKEPVLCADDKVIFLRSGPRDSKQVLYEFDPHAGRQGTVTELLRAATLLGGAENETLTPEEKARRERLRLTARGFASFELSRDETRILLPLSGRVFVYERTQKRAHELATGEGAIDPHFSHDGRSVGYVRDNNMYVIGVDAGTPLALTSGGTAADSYGTAEFVAQEELDRSRGFFFAPDDTSVVVQETRSDGVEQFAILDPSKPEQMPDKVYYPRAGKKNQQALLFRVPTRGGIRVPIVWDSVRYPYIAEVQWFSGAPLTLVVMDRVQQNLAVLAVDESGATRELLHEHDAAWVERLPGIPKWLPSGKGFLWASEQNGSWQLELRSRDGAFLRHLTTNAIGLRAVTHVDETRGVAMVVAAEEPTEAGALEVSLAGLASSPGANPRVLVDAKAAQIFPKYGDRNHAFLSYETSFRTMPVWRMRTADGAWLADLPSVAERPRLMPRVQLLHVGPDHVRVAVVRPERWQARFPLPIVDAAYGGPHVTVVQANAAQFLRPQWTANVTGAAVVLLDAKGTPHRGRAWERAIREKLESVPLEGHADTLTRLGEVAPDLDTQCIGIMGWSFGGYLSAAAALYGPPLFRAAVAGAPVTDWLEYDTAYTERYLGLPGERAQAYAGSSLLQQAATSRGRTLAKLLLIHGTADDNVYFHHSLKLADALQRQGQPFEFMVLPGTTHMLAEPPLAREVAIRSALFLRQGLAPAVCEPERIEVLGAASRNRR